MHPPAPAVALSTASVYPESTEVGFLLAAELGYDGVELMVWTDPVSQDIAAISKLSARYGVPVLAVHAPCLAVTQRVWGSDPLERLRRSGEAAAYLGASTVVVHPPFRWQRGYAVAFADAVEEVAQRYGVALAVENMFPVRRAGLRAVPYAPSEDPTEVGHRYYTLDLSHTAVAGVDALAMLDRMGEGLAHVHLADGTGSGRDEHLVPGRGNQPCADVCERLVSTAFTGVVVLEVSTRRARTRHDRAALLAEALLFARLHLQPTASPRPLDASAQPAGEPSSAQPAGEPSSAQAAGEPSSAQPAGEPSSAQPAGEPSSAQPAGEPSSAQPPAPASPAARSPAPASPAGHQEGQPGRSAAAPAQSARPVHREAASRVRPGRGGRLPARLARPEPAVMPGTDRAR